MEPPRSHRALPLRLVAILGVVLTVLVTFGYSTVTTLRSGAASGEANARPAGMAAAQAILSGGAPSGYGPDGAWTSSAAVLAVVATGSAEPCTDPVMFLPDITQWSVPPGCYGDIYRPNPANYAARPGFGWCNWWVRVRHPDHLDITENHGYPSGSEPKPGAAVFFNGNVQGADAEGHWAQVVAIAPDHYWVLISEMNFAWRGAGWARLDYRYIHAGPGVRFVYA